MDDVDPKLVGQILARAYIVLTRHQFKYFEADIKDGLTPEEMALKFDRHKSCVYKTLKKAKLIMKNEWGKRN